MEITEIPIKPAPGTEHHAPLDAVQLRDFLHTSLGAFQDWLKSADLPIDDNAIDLAPIQSQLPHLIGDSTKQYVIKKGDTWFRIVLTQKDTSPKGPIGVIEGNSEQIQRLQIFETSLSSPHEITNEVIIDHVYTNSDENLKTINGYVMFCENNKSGENGNKYVNDRPAVEKITGMFRKLGMKIPDLVPPIRERPLLIT